MDIKDVSELRIYQESMAIAEAIWQRVYAWKFFEKDAIGKQLVRAMDSVASNLSEGFGRYHYKDKKNFAYYSRGSLFETRTWIAKARNRKLVSDDEYQALDSQLLVLTRMLNSYINSIGKGPKG